MAMYRQGLRDFTSEVMSDGVGIGGGFITGGVVGRQVENLLVKTPVDANSPVTDKLLAWAANNGAKAVLYALVKTYDAGSPITREAAKALLGSAVYDTVLRLANKGYNPADISIGGYRIMGGGMNSANIQKLVQENGILRGELNKALQRLAGLPGKYERRGPGSAQDFSYAGNVSPAVDERQRRFGAMPWTPDVMERQRRYGAMPYGDLPFEQNPAKTSRERRFSFMTYPEETRLFQMYGMK